MKNHVEEFLHTVDLKLEIFYKHEETVFLYVQSHLK